MPRLFGDRHTKLSPLYEELGNHKGIYLALHWLGEIARDLGEHDRAIRLLNRSIELARAAHTLISRRRQFTALPICIWT